MVRREIKAITFDKSDEEVLEKSKLPTIDEIVKTAVSHDCYKCRKLIGYTDTKVSFYQKNMPLFAK